VPVRVLLHPRTLRATAALAVVGLIAACINWDRATSHEQMDVRAFVSDVQTLDGRSAVYVAGAVPTSTDPAIVTAEIPPLALKGGAAEVVFTGSAPFSRLVFAADGMPGYFDLALDEPVTSAVAVIVYAQDVGAPSFGLRFASGSAGTTGQFASSNVAFLGNGTGEVQVNISWNSSADVDLYVTDPVGEEIYYAHRGSHSGGQLDIDSNAACNSDGPRAENIFWPFGIVPPKGDYNIRVNYWSACGEESTDYVVTIRTKGGTPVIYHGHLTGPGVGGGAGAGIRVGDVRY
jgi:uncharacterized protein YfaP (DUF2135 family)